MRAVEQGDIEVIDMWEEGDGPQNNTFRASLAATVTHNPTQLQGRSASWTLRCLRRHAAGPGQRQQALRGEHLDVALRLGPLPHGVYRRG